MEQFLNFLQLNHSLECLIVLSFSNLFLLFYFVALIEKIVLEILVPIIWVEQFLHFLQLNHSSECSIVLLFSQPLFIVLFCCSNWKIHLDILVPIIWVEQFHLNLENWNDWIPCMNFSFEVIFWFFHTYIHTDSLKIVMQVTIYWMEQLIIINGFVQLNQLI